MSFPGTLWAGFLASSHKFNDFRNLHGDASRVSHHVPVAPATAFLSAKPTG